MGKKKKGNRPKSENLLVNSLGKHSRQQTDNAVDTKKGNSANYTTKDLMNQVDQCLENFEFDLAFKFCKKALSLDPKNVQILVECGNVCAEVGDVENARKYFMEAVKIQPNEGHVKYLYLGQLSEGVEAVKYYETAVEFMQKEIGCHGITEEKNTISNRDISTVYCSLAEIYMTDLCMEENAELICEKYCKLAIEMDESHLDAIVNMGNFLLSQNNMETAKTTVEKAYNLWMSISNEIIEGNIAEVFPYETRVTLIKLLIETECYVKVSNIFDQLIEENEDDVRIWYYLGLAKCLLKDDDDDSRFYLEKALELYEKTRCENKDMLAHIQELINEFPVQEINTIENLNEENGSTKQDDNMETE